MPISVDLNADEVGGVAGMERLLEDAVVATVRARGLNDAEISLTLLGDEAIADLNRRFLRHEGPTDVISFALFEEGELPVGDVYIGYEQALRQAADNGVSAEQELARLAVHGTLHVLGEDHPEGEERVESPMWALQERIVAGLFQ
jgi:probable rRNA maturation factor